MTLNLAENEAQAARLVSWGMAAYSFFSFAFRASAVEWGEEHALVSRIDQMENTKGYGQGSLQARLPCLNLNEGILLWI